MPARTGPPTTTGRWSLAPEREPDPTRRTHAAAEALLERHGVLTRGAVVAERVPGSFAAVYRVLSGLEEAGRTRRGYFVAGLGAAQFALPGAVDRLRAIAADDAAQTVVLAATDPANPYGAALPWPTRSTRGSGSSAADGPSRDADPPSPDGRDGADGDGPRAAAGAGGGAGHRPGRKAGALVVLCRGRLVLYVERGGRTLLSFDDDAEALQSAADALALAVRDGALGRLDVERADGTSVRDTALGQALASAGFAQTPRGLRLRG